MTQIAVKKMSGTEMIYKSVDLLPITETYVLFSSSLCQTRPSFQGRCTRPHFERWNGKCFRYLQKHQKMKMKKTYRRISLIFWTIVARNSCYLKILCFVSHWFCCFRWKAFNFVNHLYRNFKACSFFQPDWFRHMFWSVFRIVQTNTKKTKQYR